MKMLSAGFLLLAVLGGAGCGSPPEPEWISEAHHVLVGEHRLRKMWERTDASLRASGGFFLVAGDVRAAVRSEVSVKFAWLMNDRRTYAISSLPLEKIRVQFDEGIEVPTIKFRWRRCVSATETQYVMDNCVVYALITAREQDWPVQVDLPLNQ